MKHMQHLDKHTYNICIKHMQHPNKHTYNICMKHMQHLDKHTCIIRLKKQLKHWEQKLATYCTTIATYATSRSTFATSIWNACNVPLKHLKYLKQTLATCPFKHNIYLLLVRKWRLVDAELDAVWSSMPWNGAEVAGVELIGGMDLGRGRSRWMERGRDRRRESEWGHTTWVKVPSLVLANWWNLGLTFVYKWMI
jgi:hypothetical protein